MLAQISTTFDSTTEQHKDTISLRFHSFGPGRLQYSDKIEIQGGMLSEVIWTFAHLFYRHRQRRWKKLLRSNTQGAA